ncbi:hypothetical protein C1H76_5652 [Elsinoe australis]|uniref:Uncharacterized protein n=1 Tax=Elsinoe australis TaxID=40998 RepID=A0A4U7AUQ4_9PEZI|nr:hypothetical protein C1H76_5652 [Elsinoe australis]
MRFHTLIPVFAIGALAQTTTLDLASLATSISTEPSANPNNTAIFGGSLTTATTSRGLRTNASATASSTTMTIYGLNNLANTYAASVVSANQAATTLDVVCSAGNFLCPSGVHMQLTQAATSLQLSNIVTTLGVVVTESYSCAIGGTTSASCLYSVSGSGRGQSTSTSIKTSYSQSRLPYATVIVTQGQEKLAAASTIAPPPSASASQGAASRMGGMGAAGDRGVWAGLMGVMALVGALAVML